MRLPRLGDSKLVSHWILATLALSVLALLDGGFVDSWAALAPEHVWRGQLWRLVTWPLVEPGAYGLVFTCVAIYKFGGELAVRWGDRRLRRYMLAVTIAAGFAVCLVARVSNEVWHLHRTGGYLVCDVLVIAWARQFPHATLHLFHGLLELGGRRLIGFTLAITALSALSVGPLSYLPELVACFAAAYVPRDWLAR